MRERGKRNASNVGAVCEREVKAADQKDMRHSGTSDHSGKESGGRQRGNELKRNEENNRTDVGIVGAEHGEGERRNRDQTRGSVRTQTNSANAVMNFEALHTRDTGGRARERKRAKENYKSAAEPTVTVP